MFSWRRRSPSRLAPLRGGHAEECARIHAGAFAHPWTAEDIAGLLAASSAIGTAALDPATLALRGFALSRMAVDEAEILTIAVASPWRGRGVGRDLLSAHLQQAAHAGVKTIFLEVDPENSAAITLYRKFGFEKVGERPGYYRRPDGASASALLMRRELR